MAVIQPQTFATDAANEELVPNDHFKSQDGVRFAGTHLLLDMMDKADALTTYPQAQQQQKDINLILKKNLAA